MQYRPMLLGGMLVSAYLAVTGAVAASSPSESDLLDKTRRDYYLIEQLKLIHSPEVFDYCVAEHVIVSQNLQRCMLRQEGIRTDILELAQRELGRRSLAEILYYDCLDYYLGQAISTSADCVRTRLLLRERLNQADAEAEIYRRCDAKWRKHGMRAVKNCAVSAAGYYRNTGKFRD